MPFILKASLLGLGGLYVLFALAIYAVQRDFIYHPDPQRVSPQSAGLEGVEERVLETPDGERVIAWYGRAKPNQPTLLYFHGNGGSLVTRAQRIRRYLAQGRGLFMMSYRGYSGSTGSPSERANVADAKLAYDVLVKEGVMPADIIVYGESIGSGVAVQVAAAFPVGGLILDAPYTSLVDLAAADFFFLPVSLLMRDRYDTISNIAAVYVPVLIVHGEDDHVIPVAMGRAVFAAAPGPKEIATIPNAGHADHYLYGSYDKIGDWIDRLRSGKMEVSHP